MSRESSNPDLELEKFGTGEVAKDPEEAFGEHGFKIGDTVEVELPYESPYKGSIEKFTAEVSDFSAEIEYRAYLKVKNSEETRWFNLSAITEPSSAFRVTKVKK